MVRCKILLEDGGGLQHYYFPRSKNFMQHEILPMETSLISIQAVNWWSGDFANGP